MIALLNGEDYSSQYLLIYFWAELDGVVAFLS